MESWQSSSAAGTGTASGGLHKCHKCLCYVRTVTTFLFSHIGLVSLVVGYTILGAFAFEKLEARSEDIRKLNMSLTRQEVVSNLWNFTETQAVLSRDNWSVAVNISLKEFERSVIKYFREYGTDEGETQWTFSGAIFYSIIVITTIGYGNVAPKTQMGKVVTILYAVVGIPLMLLCMSNIGDTMAQSFKFVYWKVCCYFCVQSKANQQVALNRARSVRYHRYASMRGRQLNQSGGHLGLTAGSRHSSTRSGGTYQGEVGSEAGSGGSSSFYSGQAHEVDIDDGADPYSSRRRHMTTTTQQPRGNPQSNVSTSKNTELSKVPIILNKYVLESKEDLRVDLPHKDFPNSLTPSDRELERRNVSRSSSRQQRQMHRMHSAHRATGNEMEAYNESDIDLNLDAELEDMNNMDEVVGKEHVTVPIWLCCALVTSYICGGAVLFTIWEKWEFLDAAYFCFVTLTTIGFGDLVPGKKVIHDDSQTTLALCALYLLFGMALLAMSFNLVQEQVTSAVKCVGKRIGIVDDDEDDDEE